MNQKANSPRSLSIRQPFISNVPVVERHRFADVSGVLVGSDGLTDGLDEGQLAELVRGHLAAGSGPSVAAAAAVDAAIAAKRAREPNAAVDNTTAVVALFS